MRKRQTMIEHSSYNKLVGSTLANYHLEQLIERNKMGPVFLARSIATSLPPQGRDRLEMRPYNDASASSAALQGRKVVSGHGNSGASPYAQQATDMYRLRI